MLSKRLGTGRSGLMSRIRSRDTAPELRLRKALWHSGLRYRINFRIGGVRCDIAFPRARLAVFVDGCFWHGCPEHYVRPRTRTQFWGKKLRENVARDRRQTLALEAAGWRVERVWEHEVHVELGSVVSRLAQRLCPTSDDPPTTERWHVVEATPLGADEEEELRILWELRCRAPERELTQRRSTAKW